MRQVTLESAGRSRNHPTSVKKRSSQRPPNGAELNTTAFQALCASARGCLRLARSRSRAVLRLEKDRTSFTLINLEASINCTQKHRRGEVYLAAVGYTPANCRKEKNKHTHIHTPSRLGNQWNTNRINLIKYAQFLACILDIMKYFYYPLTKFSFELHFNYIFKAEPVTHLSMLIHARLQTPRR